MKRGRLKVGLLYLSFHNSLKKVYGKNRIVTKKELMAKLGRQFLVPKPLRVLAIKELVNMKLLEKQSKDNFKILDCNLNIEEEINSFFKQLSLFSIL